MCYLLSNKIVDLKKIAEELNAENYEKMLTKLHNSHR